MIPVVGSEGTPKISISLRLEEERLEARGREITDNSIFS
jgi:hypothetical protein